MTTVAVVLAAGGGSRFVHPDGVHKLLAGWRGRPVAEWALVAAASAGLDETWAVTGAVDLGPVLPAGVEVLANPRWAEGQATSLMVAVDAARARGVDALVVGLGDQPGIGPDAWRAVAAATGSPLAVATYAGRRRNPVRLGADTWSLLPVTGDEGARVVMRRRPEMVTEVPCAGDPGDIDILEDLTRWN